MKPLGIRKMPDLTFNYVNPFTKSRLTLTFDIFEGVLVLEGEDNYKEDITMKDLMLLHGWLGSCVMTYFEEFRKGNTGEAQRAQIWLEKQRGKKKIGHAKKIALPKL